MCKKCDEMGTAFQETESIIDRENLWKQYDAQKIACEKSGSKKA